MIIYSAFYKLQEHVLKSINNNDFSDALNSVKDFVSSVISSPHAPGQVISSEKLDALCELIGKKYFEFFKNNYSVSDYHTKENEFVVICTGLYKYGGSSLVIGDIVRAHKNSKCTILVTNLLDDMTQEDLKLSRICDTTAKIFIAPKTAKSAEKLMWLISKILEISPSRILLLNHHQDSVIISGVQPFVKNAKIIFYHHADYNLCLGVHMKNVIHIDPHNVGFFNCRNNEQIKDNSYLPMMVYDKKIKHSHNFLQKNELVTCTSSTFHKIWGFYLYPYIDLIIRRLIIRNGVHIHVGNIPEYYLTIILLKIRSKNINLKRFIHIPWVPCFWTLLIEKNVDLFIGSFPIGGARTFIEVMGAGIPMLMHENYLSRFYSSKDIAYSDALLWKYPEDFEKIILSIDQKELIKQSFDSRAYYEKTYSSESIDLEKEFNNIYEGRSTIPPELYTYKPDALDKFLHFNHLYYLKFSFRNTSWFNFLRKILRRNEKFNKFLNWLLRKT